MILSPYLHSGNDDDDGSSADAYLYTNYSPCRQLSPTRLHPATASSAGEKTPHRHGCDPAGQRNGKVVAASSAHRVRWR